MSPKTGFLRIIKKYFERQAEIPMNYYELVGAPRRDSYDFPRISKN